MTSEHSGCARIDDIKLVHDTYRPQPEADSDLYVVPESWQIIAILALGMLGLAMIVYDLGLTPQG